MRRLCVGILAVVALAACTSSNGKAAPPVSTTTTTIATPKNLTTAHVANAAAQTIDAFGASGAWWPIDLAKFPQVTQDLVKTLLFDPTTGGLSGYRYNIGGGGKGVKDPSRAPKQVPEDTAGLAFLKAAADRHVPVLTGFVNSAPPQFTTNGKTCGGALKRGSEAAYAKYVVDMLKYIRDNQQVTLNYISPFNEPDDSFPACGQEGMQVPTDQRAAVVQELGKALATSGLPTKIIADESASTVQFRAEVPNWLDTPDTAKYVAALAHHTYEYPSPKVLAANVPPVRKQFDKPSWMTEICCYSTKTHGGGQNYDPSMAQGLWLADDIYNDFTFAGDSAYYWWLAASSKMGCEVRADPTCPFTPNDNGFNDGLLYYDANAATTKSATVYPVKRFYVFEQFSRFIRPGSVLHAVTGLPSDVRALAFENGGQWTVVAWNESADGAQSFGIALPQSGHSVVADKTTYTDGNFGMRIAPDQRPKLTASGAWLVSIAPRTIVTYTFK